MGKEKGGFLTPKAISNRIKAKGLQKLRWYCQMCEKQCRDENGFKCHCMSESHQRQLLLFADNPDKYLDTFSKDFFDDFMYLLKRRFGTKRVHCNIVYQEYISERDHTHMNSTQWETLTEFVKWLGRESHCVVDETPKGWFITYIDKDPEVLARQKAAQSQAKHELDDQERIVKFVEKQIERVKESHGENTSSQYTVLQRTEVSDKVQFDFSKPVLQVSDSKSHRTSKINQTKKLNDLMKKPTDDKIFKDKSKTKRRCALDEILEEEEAKKKKIKGKRKENWLAEGIIVKVITKRLGEKYYKKKGTVKEVKNLFVGVVQLQGSGDILKLDQTHLETVLPAPGKVIKILNGAYSGKNAEMMCIDEKQFSATVKLLDGISRGLVVSGLPYEDISKLAI